MLLLILPRRPRLCPCHLIPSPPFLAPTLPGPLDCCPRAPWFVSRLVPFPSFVHIYSTFFAPHHSWLSKHGHRAVGDLRFRDRVLSSPNFVSRLRFPSYLIILRLAAPFCQPPLLRAPRAFPQTQTRPECLQRIIITLAGPRRLIGVPASCPSPILPPPTSASPALL